jgi:Putative esterase
MERVYVLATNKIEILILVAIIVLAGASVSDAADQPAIRISVSADKSKIPVPVTGRLFLMISHQRTKEPRLTAPGTYVYYFNDPDTPYAALFAVDVSSWKPNRTVVVGRGAVGYPYSSLSELPAGEYYIQAVFNVYTRFARADGHTIYAHADAGEGQAFNLSPGNLVSEPQLMRLNPQKGMQLRLKLTRVLPPIESVPDSRYVKTVHVKSALISRFWGADMYFGATVVLPKDYDKHPDVHYPVVFQMGHFDEGAPLQYSDEEPEAPAADATAKQIKSYRWHKAFHDAWTSDSLPRVVLISLQHPTPYYDDSYLMNSANNGPWEDAFFKEMLPFLEAKFRIIPQPYARVLFGGSTGGWVSAALQIRHPRDFGGSWSFVPDPLDFTEFCNINLYKDGNAFRIPGYEWIAPERYFSRGVSGEPHFRWRDMSRLSEVLGSKGRSGENLDMWSAVFGPVGTDGYPKPVWDHISGDIDHAVVEYWRKHDFDLREYLQRNWNEIGADLVGKLHFAVGDMDNFYLNNAVYRMQDLLEASTPSYGGSFKFGRPKIGHEWLGYEPWPTALFEEMASQIEQNSPEMDRPAQWRYQ